MNNNQKINLKRRHIATKNYVNSNSNNSDISKPIKKKSNLLFYLIILIILSIIIYFILVRLGIVPAYQCSSTLSPDGMVKWCGWFKGFSAG